MKFLLLAGVATVGFLTSTPFLPAQDGHDYMKGKSMPARPALKPAEGASVKILSPRQGQTFKDDHVPLEFKLVKGKKGHHVHAYVDNELVGMFQNDKGTLNGIKPGKHTLELVVVASDHKTELDAKDSVAFTVK
jgi:hypothetical protein